MNFSELRKDDERQLYLEDTYGIENFSKTIATKLFHAVIHDELLYEALQILTPSNREILLLKYWGEMTDAEIGRVLSMSQQRVNYNRSKSLKLLKRRIEEMIRDDKRFKF